ncbi:MAG: hypothetical protein JO152_08945 [Mycobacteriaceae bacterium]|nr:hypothetical protein [Mycobacteriaceae bacterium]
MADRTPRTIALAGVIATAVAATLLLMPSVRLFGWPDHMWVGAAVLIVPTAALLTVTGWPHYGFLRSLAVGVGVMVLTSVITWIVAVVTLAAALAGSPAGMILGFVLYATPAVCVLLFGLLALRVLPARPRAAREDSEHVASAQP